MEHDSDGRIKRFLMTRPDDWHLHLRAGVAMHDAVRQSARYIGRAGIMPNLKPPVTTAVQALKYRHDILSVVPTGLAFDPRMFLYLTDATPLSEVLQAAGSDRILGFKLYPAGATTNSDAGVTDISKAYPKFAEMEELGVSLSVHGEVTDPSVDIFDREAVFIERVLDPIVREFPGLRIVLEHVTTKDGVDFVLASGPNVAATITAHHLLYNRNAIFQGGIRPHHYCLPVLKREIHRRALVEAVTSGNWKFLFGSDSAPHAKGAKEAACGCAGCYTAPVAIELLAEIFEAEGKLDTLEQFTSLNGEKFYRLPHNSDTIMLLKRSWMVPADYPFGDNRAIPIRAGELVHWQVEGLDYPD